MPTLLEKIDVGCAAEVFVATALLHREQPQRMDFTIQEIVDRAARENVAGRLRSGLNVHASQHCVANRAPNPAKHRMLYATGKHTRRLLLPGDEVHPARTGKIFPDEGEVPEEYLPLLHWAKRRYEEGGSGPTPQSWAGDVEQKMATQQAPETPQRRLESLLEMEGLGREYLNGVDPDEYVRKLREGWE
jgi:hypothetical protein